ncbi:ATP-NAD kinase family protein [Teredinibacter waterburyi]|uniref:ATP-NAD kinase family protein n=1 Tax=Teredinibacter waterburyi TaxID=1500538 RepID=UPI001FE6067B|nr:NAD(+)/NADH kinase [Teredinibacter waterburyi]
MKFKAASPSQLKIGFLVNPYAGIGGPAGYKGSDFVELQALADKGELELRAPRRAQLFINSLQEVLARSATTAPVFIAAPSAMGCDYLRDWPFEFTELDCNLRQPTIAEDTQDLCKTLLENAIDLLVYVGGDGTARDVCAVVQTQIPVLGVPSGVKMQSGVFAISPQAAALVLAKIIAGELTSLEEEEVRDIDERALQQGRVNSRYFGSMRVPQELAYMQSVKQGGSEVEELVLLDISADIREQIDDIVSSIEANTETFALLCAPGSTTHFISQDLALPSTLLGVDCHLFSKGKVDSFVDVSAVKLEAILESLTASEKIVPVKLLLTATGGQGALIGRGNQQLTPNVLRAIGRDNLWVVATKQKLEQLAQRPLLFDSNDQSLDRAWTGLIPIITGYHDRVLYRVGINYD